MTQVTVAGGGLAGLIAAIILAERGSEVALHESGERLGGRARSGSAPYRVNFGGHALYRHGPFEAWLKQRELLPPPAPQRCGL